MFPAFKEVFERLDSNGGGTDGRRLFRNTGGGMQWCGTGCRMPLKSNALPLSIGHKAALHPTITFMCGSLRVNCVPVALLPCSAELLQRILSLNCLMEPCTNVEPNCLAQGSHAWLRHVGGTGGLGGSDPAGPALRPCVWQGAPCHVRHWDLEPWQARAPAAVTMLGLRCRLAKGLWHGGQCHALSDTQI